MEEREFINFIKNQYERVPAQILSDLTHRIKSIYAPIVKEEWGKNLEIRILWFNNNLTARARPQGDRWIIEATMGLAKNPRMTLDAIAGVICHELGHFLGGRPKKSKQNGSWSSFEGQADYFATSQCLRKYFKEQDNQGIVSKMPIPRYVTKKCRDNFSHSEDVAICQRSAAASLSMGITMADEVTRTISFQTPDTSIVEKNSLDMSRNIQCRLDTYFQGLLCNTPREDGTCLGPDGERPRCWFAPKN